MRSNQPAINALNDHHEQLQSFVNPMGANETNKQNTNLNNNWNTIKDKVKNIELCLFVTVRALSSFMRNKNPSTFLHKTLK